MSVLCDSPKHGRGLSCQLDLCMCVCVCVCVCVHVRKERGRGRGRGERRGERGGQREERGGGNVRALTHLQWPGVKNAGYRPTNLWRPPGLVLGGG